MFRAKADSRGSYTFVHVPIGQYQLSISQQGYEKQVFPHVEVQASHTTTLTAKLSAGSVMQSVEVQGDVTPVLEASSNEIGLVVDMKQIEDLPLQGRDLTSFSELGRRIQRNLQWTALNRPGQ